MMKRTVAALALVGWSVLPAAAQPVGFTFYSDAAEHWFEAGEYFEWTSTTVNNDGRTVNVHYRTFGDRSNPAIVFLHGYPTSSYDFRDMIGYLEDEYFIATLDFPGFGFSDKPQDGYSYLLADDARLVDHFVRNVVWCKVCGPKTKSTKGARCTMPLPSWLATHPPTPITSSGRFSFIRRHRPSCEKTFSWAFSRIEQVFNNRTSASSGWSVSTMSWAADNTSAIFAESYSFIWQPKVFMYSLPAIVRSHFPGGQYGCFATAAQPMPVFN